IVRHSDFIDLVVKSIMNKDRSTFSFVREEILADGSYFILYQAQSDAILLEIQPNITKVSLKRSIEKCLEVQNHIWMLNFFSLFFVLARFHCQEGISFSEDESNQNLDPLIILALYFSDNEEQKMKLRNIGDSTMQLLHTLL
ncbi:hypothetical protein CU098_009395, partial [Rhizopus stolonifer]